jgi:glycosyltransferase involved in cell wall biosynthesis
MSQPLLSLVVPVYNVAPYLPRCLESLASLTPPADEIIVVDDGSTDDCPRILAEFASRLPQMRVIRQENGGLSAARNIGMDAAHGKYLAFVDSDDFVEPDTFRSALANAEQNLLDMVMFNGWFHYEGRQPNRKIYPSIASSLPMSGRNWIVEHPLGVAFLHYVPLNLYRREFLHGLALRFITGRIHEDVVWTTEALLAANRVTYDSTPYYFYRQLIRRPSNEQLQHKLTSLIASSVNNARDLDALIERHSLAGSIRMTIANQLVDGALSIFHKLEKMPDRPAARRIRRDLRCQGFFRLLWRHARSTAQHRRIARHWLLDRLSVASIQHEI